MSDPLPDHVRKPLEKIRAHYETGPPLTQAAVSYRSMLAFYFNLLISESASVLEVGCGGGDLLSRLNVRKKTGIDLSEAQVQIARKRIPEGRFFVQAGEDLQLPGECFDCIILSETLNLAVDVQRLFERLKPVAHDETRLIVNFHSALWRPFIWAGTKIGLRHPQPASNWLSREDVAGLLHLTGWELLRNESRILCPVRLAGIERIINRVLAPLVPMLCLSNFSIARLAPVRRRLEATVSVVIPARNESGNIRAAIKRTPEMGIWTEMIFVEGNSHDNTWEEIQRVKAAYPDRKIRILQQRGRGKGDAVREGLTVAAGDLLMILDADLTVPPEELPKFYDSVISGSCEFANGSRLVYPMERHAMQFLNLCANKTFSIIFTWLLGQPVKDTLCGTKVLTRRSYEGIVRNRSYFGDFDPFGDFDLLFGASKLNLKITDIPVRYQERVYGRTNIQRWKHGWLLLKMVVFAALRFKFV